MIRHFVYLNCKLDQSKMAIHLKISKFIKVKMRTPRTPFKNTTTIWVYLALYSLNNVCFYCFLVLHIPGRNNFCILATKGQWTFRNLECYRATTLCRYISYRQSLPPSLPLLNRRHYFILINSYRYIKYFR